MALMLSGCSLVTNVERYCERRDYTVHHTNGVTDSVTYVVRDTVPEPPEGCNLPKEN